MSDVLATAALVLAMLGSAGAGLGVRQLLNDRHLSPGAVESIRLLMGMLLTFAALVLGLLTSSAKQRFDGLNDDLSAYAAGLIQLDQNLIAFGPQADPARAMLRQYTAAALADTWSNEPLPPGDYPRRLAHLENNGIEGVPLGRMLNRLDEAIATLPGPDDYHRRIVETMRSQIATTIAQRWRLIFAARSTVAWPFLLVLTSWLCIIFAIFGMTSPPTRVVGVALILSALSIASPLYLILDYSDALSGSIALASGPMREALARMDAAPS